METKLEPLIPEPAKTPSNGSVSVEAISVESIEVEINPQPTVDAAPLSAIEPDTSGIEAQLTQLLSEDLNALREGRNKSVIDTVKAAVDTLVAKANEPAAPVSETPRSESIASSKLSSEGSDPFAFDLGPSPFAPKAEPERSVHAAPAAQSPFAPFEPPHAVVRPANGSHANPTVPGSAKTEPAITEPSPAQKSRQTFAVPSVSATLGPSRKLEPLSEAFRPAPVQQEKPLPAAELAPEPVYKPESSRAPELPPPAVRSGPNESVLQPASSPALTSSHETGLDRPMEDAVADLLRPLLKTWLAENMPKIVERALRREMSERLLPGQKNPRD